MKVHVKRITIAIVLFVGLLVLCFVIKLVYDIHELSFYRKYIEKHYAAEISLVERNCMDLPNGPPSADETRRELKVAEAIGQSLQSSEIYAASWSDDGHHGAQYLKRPEAGGSTFFLKSLSSCSPDGSYRIYYGRTVDQRKLLIYEGWVPGGRKRQYCFEFILSDIKDAANREQADGMSQPNE